MISREKFEDIRSKHGEYASWAVWAPQGNKPTSNIGDLSVFDLEKSPSMLEVLNPEIVLVGLN